MEPRLRRRRSKPEDEPRDPSRRGLESDTATSQRLRAIPRQGTRTERAVRRLLHEAGLRFRIENGDLPGSPDVANRRNRWAVFVHGCFWHHHVGCPRATVPKRNADFWKAKFAANRARDERAVRYLHNGDYYVLTLWECEVSNQARLRQRLSDLFHYARGKRAS
ncbi:DNA mismatch endonuclease Vsr [bacterium]|nr:DNA mismatch endonuclease Vsr [bacterium]